MTTIYGDPTVIPKDPIISSQKRPYGRPEKTTRLCRIHKHQLAALSTTVKGVIGGLKLSIRHNPACGIMPLMPHAALSSFLRDAFKSTVQPGGVPPKVAEGRVV